jgi:hypothetical protein
MPPAAWARILGIKSVYTCKYKSLRIPTLLQSTHSKAERQVLVDSGATDNFISNKLLKRMKIGKLNLPKPRTIWNIDGTHNKSGHITHFVDLLVRCGDRSKEMRFLITDLGEDEIVLGYPWLAAFRTKNRLEERYPRRRDATLGNQDLGMENRRGSRTHPRSMDQTSADHGYTIRSNLYHAL